MVDNMMKFRSRGTPGNKNTHKLVCQACSMADVLNYVKEQT